MHRPTRKRFPRNPYMVINMMDVWECDLMYMHSLSKYKEKFKYLLSVKDFSRSAYISYRCGPRRAQP